MISVTFYDLQSGSIRRRAMLEQSMVDINTADGEGWIEGFWDGSKFMVVDGQPVEIPAQEIEQAEIETAWFSLRTKRRSLLEASDWTQVPDAPVDREAWAVYRQQLRDLPKNTTDPRNPVWPTPPA
jgi:hypothetical protein